jgi:dihydrosphingosine 1-phosphate phosphatase
MQALRDHIETESRFIARIQIYRTKMLDRVFVWIGRVFSHVSYVILIPILFWFSSQSPSQDTYMPDPMHVYARAFVFMVCIGVYTTGFFKDLLKLPRPTAPAVRIAEHASTNFEYGFPSTHAVHVLSISLVTADYFSEYAGGWVYGLAIVASLVVGFSRVYTGMHSMLDIVGGYILGSLLYSLYKLFFQQLIEYKIMNAGIDIVVVIVISAWIAMKLHPEPDGCPCIVDSVASLGAYSGVLIGSWLRKDLVLVNVSVYGGLIRVAVGSVVLVMWRWIGKTIVSFMFKRYEKEYSSEKIYINGRYAYSIKYLIYNGIGVLATFCVPRLFNLF